MKVLHILSDSNIGGAGTYVLKLARNCDRDRFDIVVALPQGARMAPLLREVPVETVECGMAADRSYDRRSIGVLAAIIRAYAPDLVHTHGSLSGRLAARRSGVRSVFTKHTLDPVGRGPLSFAKGRYNASLSDRAIAVSRAAAQNLVANGFPKDKIRVIYNGTGEIPRPDAAAREELRRSLGVSPEEALFLIVARLEPVKDHETFLKAAALAAKRVPSKFVIVGGGSLMDPLKKQAGALGIAERCVFTGERDDAEPFYQAADVFVLTSRSENMPLTLLEAMSASLPVIATGVGGIPEAVDAGSAILCPAGDARAVSDAMVRLAESEALRRELASGARRRYEEAFTVSRFVDETTGLYTELEG